VPEKKEDEKGVGHSVSRTATIIADETVLRIHCIPADIARKGGGRAVHEERLLVTGKRKDGGGETF